MKKNHEGIKRKYGGVRASIRKDERRKKLMAAGLSAFGTTGYAKTSIKSICELAGLTERYFYESFKNKEELLALVYNKVVDELTEKALEILNQPDPISLEAVMEAVQGHFETFQENPEKARVLYFEVLGVSPGIDHEYRSATDRLENIISLAISKAFPSIDIKALQNSITPTALAGAVNLVVERWVLDGFETPLQDILSQIEFFLKPRPGF